MKYFLFFVWIATALPANASGQDFRVRLRAEVTVEGKTVRLSDLLPDNAGGRLKAAAESLSLGRAPQIGSLRVFSANKVRQAIAEIPLATTEIDIPEQVVVRRIGWPLQTENITRTLSHSKFTHALDFSKAKIVLPPGFSSIAVNPQIEVTAFNSNSGHQRLLASMRCRERAVCGSFLVEVLNVLAEAVPSRELRQGSEKVAESGLSSIAGPVLVRPGRLALLVIEGDGIRITQLVMPLKSARLGEVVRVSDPRTHRSWLAQASGNGTLRPEATQKEEAR
jgi:hypothetical protein